MGKSLDEIERAVIRCRRCPELRAYAAHVAKEKRLAYRDHEYWGKPVPAFGDPRARVVLVGLAPGAHGSNRTGRMFTGDASGDFLFPALYRAGFASQPNAVDANDGLTLHDCSITAAGRCAPPANKPTPAQLANCFPYLVDEFAALTRMRVVIGLGKIGFDAAVRALKELGYDFDSKPVFAHGARARATKGSRSIDVIASYHPSRQNTNTGVLTAAMFDRIFTQAAAIVRAGEKAKP